MNPQKTWQAVLGELEVTVSKANFTTWLKNTALDGVQGEVARVLVPNAFTREWLQRKYVDEILEVLVKHLPDCRRLEFKVGSLGTPAAASAPDHADTSSGPADASSTTADSDEETAGTPFLGQTGGLHRNSFKNFIVGGSTQLAYAVSTAVAKNPGGTYNPLFLYGGVGLGKTHLMQAIGREVAATTEKKVLYVTAEKYTNDFISAISQNRTAAFKSRYRKVDVLLIDDIQFLAGKESTQEEFFHTFNALHQDGRQIVMTSDRPPKAIPALEERLRSRLEWGMTADLGMPELETRTAILQAKAKERHYDISLEVLNYIAKSVQQNIRELEGALIRIVAHAELTGTAPTPELAKEILGAVLASRHTRQASCSQIIEAVSRFYDVSIDDLKGPKRQKEIVKPRQMTMFLMREETNLSYPRIGAELGGRDHTTVIHAVGKIARTSEEDEPLRHELSLIKERLYA